MKTRPPNLAYIIIVWIALGLLPVHAAPISDVPVGPKWINSTIWKSSATMRSYCEEAATYAVVSVSPDSVYYENGASSQSVSANGISNLVTKIYGVELKFSAKAGDPGRARGYVYAGIYDGEYNQLFSANDVVEAVSNDDGWRNNVDLDFNLTQMVELPLESTGDEIQGIQVAILDRNGDVVKSYWLQINWYNNTVRYPTGLTGDLIDANYEAEIVFHRWNSTKGSYSQSFNFKTGEENPIGEVTVGISHVDVNGIVFSNTSAVVNPTSSNGVGILPLVVLELTNLTDIAFGGKTTEGERAIGFRIRKLGPTGFNWQEYNLPTGFDSSLMTLEPGKYHVEYMWPSFREEKRYIYEPWYGEGKG